MDLNQWHVQMTMRVPSFYEQYNMFSYTLYSMNNDNGMCYLWTIIPDISKEGIHVLVEFELLQSQGFSDVQHTHVSTHEDHSNVCQHITAITQMILNGPSMLYPDVQKDDEDDDNDDVDDDISSASDDDNAFLDMGSGEQIDDFIESRTIQLLE
ncbi:hypothetical protein M9H77_26656 [Catharanthus roseus]|uniref:Uncharacterized protein n=1 Tax=Catharanthus roseus TaxID=4058 RepID=A0ACC0AEJ8_CATRO|nr:hypothetical protein M9H77_26656 [Catharanthus roseus]